jgi:hypothetical protein
MEYCVERKLALKTCIAYQKWHFKKEELHRHEENNIRTLFS